jgi:hypothetical protein
VVANSVGDRVHDGADLAAEEAQGDDGNDRSQCKDQRIFDESLTLLEAQ